MLKSIIFVVKSCLGNVYRNLAIFFWSHCLWSSWSRLRRRWREIFFSAKYKFQNFWRRVALKSRSLPKWHFLLRLYGGVLKLSLSHSPNLTHTHTHTEPSLPNLSHSTVQSTVSILCSFLPLYHHLLPLSASLTFCSWLPHLHILASNISLFLSQTLSSSHSLWHPNIDTQPSTFC